MSRDVRPTIAKEADVIERILPPGVVSATAYDDPAAAVLLPEEEAFVARAVEKRQREFATVRWCARRALAALGLPATAVLPGESGAPRWPEGVVGSMTHCAGYRAAALARAAEVAAIGVDAEPDRPLPHGVLDAIARDEERTALRALVGGPHWDRLLFSAKESVYKAWFPLTSRWLGFQDVSLELRADGTFRARLLVPDPPYAELSGRWLVADGLLATAVTEPRRPTSPPARSRTSGRRTLDSPAQ